MTTLRRTFTAALAVAALGGLAACGEKTLDKGDAEGEIEEKLKAQNVDASSVECPDDMTAKKDETYTCKAKVGGKEVDVKLTMLDDDGKFQFVLQQ
jgi:uncharacterized lipoprotein